MRLLRRLRRMLGCHGAEETARLRSFGMITENCLACSTMASDRHDYEMHIPRRSIDPALIEVDGVHYRHFSHMHQQANEYVRAIPHMATASRGGNGCVLPPKVRARRLRKGSCNDDVRGSGAYRDRLLMLQR